MFDMGKIIGKKIICIKCIREDRRTSLKYIRPIYILFDDEKTFIELVDQDYYTYHDCAYGAKHIEINVDKNHWDTIINDDDHYPPATTGI